MFFGIDEARIKEAGGYDTAKEILQQPRVIKKLFASLAERESEINNFLRKTSERRKIILTGAGSSEFVGCAAYHSIKRALGSVEAVATTNLITAPETYISKNDPTLLVSFARSGDSPESVACAELVEKLSPDPFHLIITCNKNGKLYRRFENAGNALALLMPEEANDRGFAMTSSVTSMLLAAVIALGDKPYHSYRNDIEALAEGTEKFFNGESKLLRGIVEKKYKRAVFLGSDNLRATACESALKLMELTNGEIAALYDSPLGFRHGPKTFLNCESEKALTVMLFSNDEYVRRYEFDLFNELRSEGRDIAAVFNKDIGDAVGCAPFHLSPEYIFTEGAFLSVLHLAFSQALAFLFSHRLGYNTDSPVAGGTLSRVVAGVTIHPYERAEA